MGHAQTEVARTGHRGQKEGDDNPTPTLPTRGGEGSGNADEWEEKKMNLI